MFRGGCCCGGNGGEDFGGLIDVVVSLLDHSSQGLSQLSHRCSAAQLGQDEQIPSPHEAMETTQRVLEFGSF